MVHGGDRQKIRDSRSTAGIKIADLTYLFCTLKPSVPSHPLAMPPEPLIFLNIIFF